MKKYTSFMLLAFLACCLSLIATTSNAQECGTAQYVKVLQARYPELMEKRAMMEQKMREQQGKPLFNGLITIPVVVHVVFNNAAENIPDAQIYNQLEVLNEDYRRYNQDVSIVANVFQPLVSDIEIQFCLASVDPGGNPTTGITRTATTHGSFPVPATTATNDDVKHTVDGGIDAWNSAAYLNIWVCAINGARGYSPYPGTSPADQDGIVVDFGAFGSVLTGRGRTAAHEIGHWLNLVHIFGDNSPADCADTDDVADTPNQEASHLGDCPTFPSVSCSNGPNGDLFYNHMDYTNHNCRVMFTTGQRDRMRAQFMPGGLRTGLLTSNGCGGTCPRARFVTNDYNSATETLQADDAIYGWNTVSGNSNIVYDAGDSIKLKPPFHALSGNRFRAKIGGCAGPQNEDFSEASGRQSSHSSHEMSGELRVFPNPFRDLLSVQFEVSKTSSVTVRLTDALGRLVAAPLQNVFEAGQHTVQMEYGQVPQGMYYITLSTPDALWVQKVMKSE